MKRNAIPPVASLGWLWLLGGLTLVLAPHLLRFPPWLGLLCLAAIAWRLARDLRGWKLPGTGVRLFLTLGSIGAVFVAYGTLIGRDAGVALLAVMLSLKLMEMTTLRDAMLVVLLAYFLVASGFLFSQSLLAGAYLFGTVVVLTGALIVLNHPLARSGLSRRYLAHAGGLILQATPLMAVLFILFPRVPGIAAFQLAGAPSSRTGLSDHMTMGDVDALASSREVAFRVEFKTPPPSNPDEWYWRGPVLWHSDGRTWRGLSASELRSEGVPHSFERSGAPVDYIITLEPGSGRWLMGLELPVTVPRDATLTSDLQILAARPLRQTLRYAMRSYPRYRMTAITPRARAAALALPEASNPLTRELGASWARESASEPEVVGRALALFREQPFYYTRRPPILGKNPVDDFLFHTRRGFCEHYAAAFVTLMRSAGIPARIVMGYEGGEFNPLGNYWIVRQSDAHAWAEVYLDGKGWVRIDPTTAILPSRIEQDLRDRTTPGGADRPVLPWPMRALRWVGDGWDAVNYQWYRWVADYSEARQQELLSRLGLQRLGRPGLILFLTGSALVIVLLTAAWLSWRSHREADPALRLYRRFCHRLSLAGLPRHEGEGEKEFAERIGKLRPELAAPVQRVTEAYQLLRYGPKGRMKLRDLKRVLAAIRV